MFRLYLLRHGIAISRDDPECPEETERYLTEEGQSKVEQIVCFMKRMKIAPEVIYSSPWTRAVQTAEAAKGLFPGLTVHKTDTLLPWSPPNEILEEIIAHEPVPASILIAGHEPHLSRCISFLLTGNTTSDIRLKKGGLCCMDVDLESETIRCRLLWLVTPAQMIATVQ